MLRRNLPDLKTDKGQHYAEILTSLYKQQMRLIWEETKAYERRARELASRKETREGRDEGPLGPQETEQQSLAPEKSPEGRNDGRAPEVKHAKPDKQQDSSKGQLEQGSHRNAGAAKPSSAIDADRIPTQRAANRINGGDVVTGRVDKTSLPIKTPRRIRDKDHLRYVASQPCIICGRAPGQAHHLRFAQPRALGRKVSDEWTVPLCSTHHSALHSVGDEERWWKDKGIDPIAHAVRLWWDTRHGTVQHEAEMAPANCGHILQDAIGLRKY